MEIDWFTTAAQVVNFLVLVWLLKRFLYKPVIDAMDAREERIAGRLEQAEKREEEASEEAQHLEAERDSFARQQKERMDALERELAEERKRLLEEAREEVAAAKQEWLDALERDQEGLLREFRQRAETRLFGILRHVLADVADSDLEERTISVFLERFASLEEAERLALTPTGHDGAPKVHVRTAFELDDAQRAHLRDALKRSLTPDLEVDFGEDEALIAGIELRLDGRKFGWSLSDYLDGLEEELWTEVRELAPSGSHNDPGAHRRVS
ncbi:F0F1 ATP synthase subunit B [Persicimonas caeni]|uniref:ATP synthase subunit b n=1 Tax=Persicimonas caeni TaxID=2292766 RepID=A0A4Y6PQ10_PERCE|nr:F0F1 ATP synthase subunit delta [Persicimonas caeni]QDG50422.1 F0F1 ATP synthase subunit B [Persicimonas caeni]QED31643.1 F0F1 ATP synthase subunit B [Persicimonas caeni]